MPEQSSFPYTLRSSVIIIGQAQDAYMSINAQNGILWNCHLLLAAIGPSHVDLQCDGFERKTEPQPRSQLLIIMLWAIVMCWEPGILDLEYSWEGS